MRQKPIMTVRTGHAEVKIELYPESAPNAVSNMIRIINQKLLDHRQIRRIAPGYVVQPSFCCFDDPRLAMELPGEFSANGFENGGIMREGSVGMAGDGATFSSGSEFFFCLSDEAGQSLQGKYSVIGQVTEGWDEIRRLESVPSHRMPFPGDDNVVVFVPDSPEEMISVTVETFGEKYPAPRIIGWQNLSGDKNA